MKLSSVYSGSQPGRQSQHHPYQLLGGGGVAIRSQPLLLRLAMGDGGGGGMQKWAGRKNYPQSFCFSHRKLGQRGAAACAFTVGADSDQPSGSWRGTQSRLEAFFSCPRSGSCFSQERALLRLAAFIKMKTRVYRTERLLEGACGRRGG